MPKEAYQHQAFPGGMDRPLLFLFHGTGGDEDQLIGLGPEILPGASYVAPRGDVSEHGAARFFRRTGEGVYDMEDLARRTRKMEGFIRAHVGEMRPSAVIGLGYSNGANILASVIFAAPSLFDAAVLMHPLIPFEPQIEGGRLSTRILMTAGRRDPICPPDLTSRLQSYLEAAHAPVTPVWHDGGHEIRPGEIAAAAEFLMRYRRQSQSEET